MISHTLGNLVRASVLGSLDRTLGIAFGVARAGFLAAAAYIALGMLVPTENWPEAVRQARSLPYAHSLAVWLVQCLPDQYRPKKIPEPPAPRETNSADLLHATPQGRALARP
jgi:membrane protein required for colicin V production